MKNVERTPTPVQNATAQLLESVKKQTLDFQRNDQIQVIEGLKAMMRIAGGEATLNQAIEEIDWKIITGGGPNIPYPITQQTAERIFLLARRENEQAGASLTLSQVIGALEETR